MSPLEEIRFGAGRLLLAQRLLLWRGTPVKLGARAFELLRALIERRERVVDKRELLALIWPNVVVEENNLQVHIAALRKVLGADAIVTVPSRGYQFTLAVQETPAMQDEAPADSLAGPAASPLSGQPAPAVNNVIALAGAADRVSAPASRGHNIPAANAPLYGRAADIARVRELLAGHRIVSIVGSGGIGKSRLAHAVAQSFVIEAPASYRDGVWLIELAALADEQLVASSAGRVLGVPLAAARAPVEAVINALRTQAVLLVLDNCEHVLPAVAQLARAIAAAGPDVSILVTSQEPLKIAEERVLRLDALALPDASASDLECFGAVQLLLGRACASGSSSGDATHAGDGPRFALTADNRDAVIEICRRLDGIPLALELAGARIPLLGFEGLRARLDQRFRVLTGGARLELPQHKTLRAALDFSHGLLSPGEQAVFRRLAVFAGSFALDVAQEVAADEEIDRWQVLEHLGALVDKSMVIAAGAHRPRLRLLESARVYALEQLYLAGETALLAERHARAVARLIARTYDDHWQMSDRDWFDRYEPELDNVRVALAWAFVHDPQCALALVGDALPIWQELALQPEALRYCESALAAISGATTARAAGRLWYALALITASAWPARSRDAAERAVELLRDADDAGVFARALARLASCSRFDPESDQFSALEELRQLNDPAWPGRMRKLLPGARAMIHRAAGRLAAARRDYEEARDICLACGNDVEASSWQTNVAEIALMQGDFDGAIAICRDLVQRMAARRDQLFYMYALVCLAAGLLFKGDVAATRAVLAEAMPLIVRYEHGFRFANTAALLAVSEGRAEVAACLLGYSDVALPVHGDARDPVESIAREQAMSRLAACAAADAIAQWQRAGAQLNDSEAHRLFLAEIGAAR